MHYRKHAFQKYQVKLNSQNIFTVKDKYVHSLQGKMFVQDWVQIAGQRNQVAHCITYVFVQQWRDEQNYIDTKLLKSSVQKRNLYIVNIFRKHGNVLFSGTLKSFSAASILCFIPLISVFIFGENGKLFVRPGQLRPMKQLNQKHLRIYGSRYWVKQAYLILYICYNFLYLMSNLST